MWISVNDESFPNEEFLAAWIEDDGDIAQIEWYVSFDVDSFMNMNSMNINKFDKNDTQLIRRPPTHWMYIPEIK